MKKHIQIALVFVAFSLVSVSCNSEAKEQLEMKSEETVTTIYQCPMKCEGEKTYQQAGTCPVCGMDLKALEAAGESVE